MKNVICMKWGDKFSPKYVNILASRVRQNLSCDYRFVCFTDDTTGLRPEIETRPLPEMTGLEGRPERGWRKLTLFQEKLDDLEGTALFLDLDVVIADSLDPFFGVPGSFRIIEDWNLRDRCRQLSVFPSKLGVDRRLSISFRTAKVYAAHRNEQAYLSWRFGEGRAQCWDPEWCQALNVISRRFPSDISSTEPAGVKVIVSTAANPTTLSADGVIKRASAPSKRPRGSLNCGPKTSEGISPAVLKSALRFARQSAILLQNSPLRIDGPFYNTPIDRISLDRGLRVASLLWRRRPEKSGP